MSVPSVCSACGKTFTADAPSMTPLCRDCRTAAVSEQPIPAPSTGVHAGMPPVGSAASAGDAPTDIRRPPGDGWPGALVVMLVLIGAALAACVFLMLVCA